MPSLKTSFNPSYNIHYHNRKTFEKLVLKQIRKTSHENNFNQRRKKYSCEKNISKEKNKRNKSVNAYKKKTKTLIENIFPKDKGKTKFVSFSEKKNKLFPLQLKLHKVRRFFKF
jgi:hypothetical protein